MKPPGDSGIETSFPFSRVQVGYLFLTRTRLDKACCPGLVRQLLLEPYKSRTRRLRKRSPHTWACHFVFSDLGPPNHGVFLLVSLPSRRKGVPTPQKKASRPLLGDEPASEAPCFCSVPRS